MDQPIGDQSFGPVFIRAAMGYFLLASGLNGLDNPQKLMDQVSQLQVFGGNWDIVYAILFPYLEVLAGSLIIAGFWTTFASILACLILGSLIYIFGVNPDMEGPFGIQLPFNKDIILFASALSLMFTGPGALSIDKFRNG